jgi:hypothetical protein
MLGLRVAPDIGIGPVGWTVVANVHAFSCELARSLDSTGRGNRRGFRTRPFPVLLFQSVVQAGWTQLTLLLQLLSTRLEVLTSSE